MAARRRNLGQPERAARAHVAPFLAVLGTLLLFASQVLLIAGLASGFEPLQRLVSGIPRRALGALALATTSLGALLALFAARAIARVARADRRALQVAEEALQQREEFLGLAAHELRTPLTAVLLEIGAAAREARRRGDGSVLRLLSRAELASRRLGDLVSQLLASREDDPALALEDVDLSELARAAVEERAELFRKARCEVRISARAPVIGRWDRARLDRALSSLLANAAKYGQGYPIDVRVEEDGARARLAIRDHGIGIPPERRERIFERFERGVSPRNYGGLGLGLWLTRREVLALGGSVTVESRPGAGATFTLEIPRFPGERMAGAATA
jgi:signal transduction histidine kinase